MTTLQQTAQDVYVDLQQTVYDQLKCNGITDSSLASSIVFQMLQSLSRSTYSVTDILNA